MAIILVVSKIETASIEVYQQDKPRKARCAGRDLDFGHSTQAPPPPHTHPPTDPHTHTHTQKHTHTARHSPERAIPRSKRTHKWQSYSRINPWRRGTREPSPRLTQLPLAQTGIGYPRLKRTHKWQSQTMSYQQDKPRKATSLSTVWHSLERVNPS